MKRRERLRRLTYRFGGSVCSSTSSHFKASFKNKYDARDFVTECQFLDWVIDAKLDHLETSGHYVIVYFERE